jgi:hypothetical protein
MSQATIERKAYSEPVAVFPTVAEAEDWLLAASAD